MTAQLLQSLIDRKAFPDSAHEPTLIETHISWVVLTDHFAFKIKKPVHFTFLDFSSLSKRAYYCQREVTLNQRLAPKIYLGVLPIFQRQDGPVLGGSEGIIIDYAVWMKRLDSNKEMDRLLVQNEVREESIRALAKQLAAFHLNHRIKKSSVTPLSIKADFDGIKEIFGFAKKQWGEGVFKQLKTAIDMSGCFLKEHHAYIMERARSGCIVDGHGDLHCGNIFILDQPVIFDCIEFDDHFRTLDILNELGFLFMDLDRFNRNDLAQVFLQTYMEFFPCMNDQRDEQLLLYYKWYRANVRFKINCLHAMGSNSEISRQKRLQKAMNYLKLFQKYMESLLIVSSYKSYRNTSL